MLKFPKSWTGVEKKDDGTLVYSERGAFIIWFKKNRLSCTIDDLTFTKIKVVVFFEYLTGYYSLAYLRHTPQTISFMFLIAIASLIVDTIIGYCINLTLRKKYIFYDQNQKI